MCERDPKCKDLLIDNNECCPKCKDENGKHCSYFALFQLSAISLILLKIHEKRTKMTKKEIKSATETKFLYPLLFAQSIVSNVLKIMVNFIFVKS